MKKLVDELLARKTPEQEASHRELFDELKGRFPNLRPIKVQPGMVTINGIGTKLYGRRDFDAETGSYISTLSFTFLFIPLFFLRAYRVTEEPPVGTIIKSRAWYFIGSEPLSKLALVWNCIGGSFILFCAGWMTVRSLQ